jgi:hypothetical protein
MNIEIKAKIFVGVVTILLVVASFMLSFYFPVASILSGVAVLFAFMLLIVLEMYLRVQHNLDRNFHDANIKLSMYQKNVDNIIDNISGINNSQKVFSKEMVDFLNELLIEIEKNSKNIIGNFETINTRIEGINTSVEHMSTHVENISTNIVNFERAIKTIEEIDLYIKSHKDIPSPSYPLPDFNKFADKELMKQSVELLLNYLINMQERNKNEFEQINKRINGQINIRG